MIRTPGAYLKHRRQAAGLALVDVAAALATEPRLAEHARAEWIERIEADVAPASFATIVALRRAYRFDINVLLELAAIQMGVLIEAPQLCRICACSEEDACPGLLCTCHWVDRDLCSACADRLDPAVLAAIAAAEATPRAVTA